MFTADGDLVICVVKKKAKPLHPFTAAVQKCLLSVNKIRQHDARCVLRFVLCIRLNKIRQHDARCVLRFVLCRRLNKIR